MRSGQGKVGREIPQYLNSDGVPSRVCTKRAPLLLLTGKVGRRKWAGKGGQGSTHDREILHESVHENMYKSVHEIVHESVHEKMNRLYGQLNKRCIKQIVSRDPMVK